MYNNITKFINPKYATLFLIVLGGILLALFMNSRYKEGYTNAQINSKLGEKLNEKDLNEKLKTTGTINSINSNIRNIKKNKLDSNSSVITNLQKDVNDKLGTKSKVITDLQNEVSMSRSVSSANNRDMGNLYKFTRDLNNNKLDISSSVITDLQAGIKTKLDASVFDSTMKNVPTGNTLAEMVDGKINSKAGDINAAKDLFEKNAATKIIEFDANAADKTASFNGTAVAQTASFNSNADTQRNAFNGLFDNKYGTFDSYAKVATNTLGSMKDASVSAAERAEAALNQSIQIQNNIFGASSEKMITQANQYNTNYTNSSVIDTSPGLIYDPSGTAPPIPKERESFTNITSPYSSSDQNSDNKAIYDKIEDYNTLLRTSPTNQNALKESFKVLVSNIELFVKGKIQIYKDAAKNYNDSPSAGKLTTLKNAGNDLSMSITLLKTAYESATPDDQTASIKSKASAIDSLRRELDTKMQQVLNKQDITNEYDSTVYTGIMWSVLGTSLLYYIFTEM